MGARDPASHLAVRRFCRAFVWKRRKASISEGTRSVADFRSSLERARAGLPIGHGSARDRADNAAHSGRALIDEENSLCSHSTIFGARGVVRSHERVTAALA